MSVRVAIFAEILEHIELCITWQNEVDSCYYNYFEDGSLAEALLISQQTFLTQFRRRSDGEGGSKD